jgi:hypothetical protein
MKQMTDSEILADILKTQKEQNDLLRKHLTRIKFSLWSLFLLMTLLCIFFGISAYQFSSSKWSSGLPPQSGTLSIQGGQLRIQTGEMTLFDAPQAFEPADEPAVLDAPAIK